MALGKDDRALLQRWLDDDRASDVWSAIRAHAEQYDGPIGADAPIYFIVFILTAKRAGDSESKANASIAAQIAEVKQLKAELQGKIARSVKQIPFEKAAKFLEDTGKMLHGCPLAVTSKPRVRSDRGGRRVARFKMQGAPWGSKSYRTRSGERKTLHRFSTTSQVKPMHFISSRIR
jgi:hypothetical protein